MNRLAPALALLLTLAAPAAAQKITVTGGKTDATAVVVKVSVPKGTDVAKSNAVELSGGGLTPLQVAGPGLTDDPAAKQYLVFVISKLNAGETMTARPVTLDHPKSRPPQFHFVEEKGKYTDLLYERRPVLRYVNAPHDPANHFLTFKPFHHVFDPSEGKTLLTSGAYKDPKGGLYPHHRGLFFGWNKISYDGQAADIWHGTDGVFSQHEKVLATEAGEVFGRQRSAISWHGKDGQTFLTEERELTAYAALGGTLIDFASVLKTDRPKVKLDGDPQHAGFHFRANMELGKKVQDEEAAAKKENRKPAPSGTYYLRPDGKGAVDETRNWDAKKPDPKTVNLPWDAMSFLLGGKRYTVLRINHPGNPGEARGSERNYGRFGDYFEYELTPEKPLRVKYRVWVQEGEMTGEQCAAIAAAFRDPPAVKVK